MSNFRKKQKSINKQAVDLPLNQNIYIKNIYPCILGIVSIGKISLSILEIIKSQIDSVFNDFFYDILLIREVELENRKVSPEIKEEFNLLDNSLKKVSLFPTEDFFSTVRTQMLKNNLTIGLGLTNFPIYSSSDEGLLFLFGEANLKHRCAIVSTHNLLDDNENDVADSRIIKETIHEIGHLILGAKHCDKDNCVMMFSETIGEIDKKSNYLCEKCKSELEKIKIFYNF
jgi:predicted Zn-dependent protease